MRAGALWLALIVPLPVTSLVAFVNSDGSVTLSWVLPDDSTLTGVTVLRQRLDVVEPDVTFDLGLDRSFTDFSTIVAASYRYRVQTRNGLGDLSVGVFVDVFISQPVVFVNTAASGGWIFCSASVQGEPSLLPIVLTAALVTLLCGGRRRAC